MKILIAEDDATIQRAYRRMFHRYPQHEVVIAGDPIEARRLMADGFTPDVIISDWEMPRANGGEFCAILRAEGNDVRFYIVSGQVRIREAAEAGATGSFTKPLYPEDLQEILGEKG